MQGLNLDQVEQVHHFAQLGVLAMCARGVASNEFDTNPEVMQVVVVVCRPVGGTVSPTVDLSFIGTHSVPLGGMSL